MADDLPKHVRDEVEQIKAAEEFDPAKGDYRETTYHIDLTLSAGDYRSLLRLLAFGTAHSGIETKRGDCAPYILADLTNAATKKVTIKRGDNNPQNNFQQQYYAGLGGNRR